MTSVEEPAMLSCTWRCAEAVEEAEEMKPFSKMPRPERVRVDEAEKWSVTWNGPETVDDAPAMKTLSNMPRTDRVRGEEAERWSEMWKGPETVLDACATSPCVKYPMPAPSITKRSLVPSAVEEAILNLPASEISMPSVQSKSPFPVVEVAESVTALSCSRVAMWIRLSGVEVPI